MKTILFLAALTMVGCSHPKAPDTRQREIWCYAGDKLELNDKPTGPVLTDGQVTTYPVSNGAIVGTTLPCIVVTKP